jgi:aryl-alcohol dehydrogenase-like predicted oxidoreductase
MLKTSNNKLILGTVQMGLPYGINNTKGKISLEESIEILEYAQEKGIEILDSAEAYGNAHQVIGEYHRINPEKKFKVISKLPNQLDSEIGRKVDAYLAELRIGQLYAILFHSFTSYIQNKDNFDELIRIKRENKIKHIGVSVYTNEEIEQVLLNQEIDIIQLPFNLFDNINLRGKILEKAKYKGKTIHTRSALLQGLFFKDPKEQNEIVQKLKKEMILLAEISKKHSISTSELALSYCMSQEMINNVLIGIDSLDQLKENIESANYKIKSDIINDINSIYVSNPDDLNPSLWN